MDYLCTCCTACREQLQDDEPVFPADLFSASLSSQQRCELAQQKYTPQPEAEPLNFLLQAVKDGEQMQPGESVAADAQSLVVSVVPAYLSGADHDCTVAALLSRLVKAGPHLT
jgi:hypothetical protein